MRAVPLVLVALALVIPATAHAQTPPIWQPLPIDLSQPRRRAAAGRGRRAPPVGALQAPRRTPASRPSRPRARCGYKGHVGAVHRPKPFFYHLRNTKLHEDGRELDPRFPEAVVYWYDPPRPLLLVAFMYRVHEGKEPAYARSVLPWHSHCDGWSVVMHTWFTDDLRSGIARKPPRPEFATAFKRDFGDPTPDSASGCQPKGHGDHDAHGG